jgi:hypothetical protein
MTQDAIISIIKENGPLTGAQLIEQTKMEVLALWQSCRKIPSLQFEQVGKRYLRLDRNVKGYARLSPSIRREFLTYTFVGLDSQAEELKRKADAFRRETNYISQEKSDIAQQSVVSTVASLQQKDAILEKTCFLLAGDVVYDMSHKVPRPEKSTGEMVLGSDLDLIIIVEDDLDAVLIDVLDKAIHKRKHLLLKNDREEIDYLIKTISRVKEQLRFDIFSSMVACKILNESKLLYGNTAVYQEVKDLVAEYGIPERLKEMEDRAIAERASAEAQLLETDEAKDLSEYLNLFYTHAEEDEIY